MKTKLFTLFAVSFMTTMTAAYAATITYQLNGGVTNDYGWISKNDMFQACMADCGVTDLASLDQLQAAGDASFTTIAGKLTDVSGMLSNSKWDWLEAYIMSVQNAETGATALVEGTTSAGWRYAVAAFFLEMKRTGWPVSADFSDAGRVEVFQSAWKHGFANPTNPTTTFTLNAPYKANDTFKGWYTTATFSGSQVTTVNASTTGTLYAKWASSVQPATKDTYAYPKRDNKYSLTNNWLYSAVEGNFDSNQPGQTDYVRGMDTKDGIIYFINRETASITRIDGATGKMLTPINITGTHLFETQTNGTWASAVTFPYNDIHFDSAGNCLIGALISTGSLHFMIYEVNLTTGAATLLIDECLWDNPTYDQLPIRFDAFGVLRPLDAAH